MYAQAMTTQQINSKKLKKFVNFEIFAVGEPRSDVAIFLRFLVFGLCLPKRAFLQTYKTKKKKFFCLFLSQPTEQSAPKVIAKIENLVLSLGYRYVTQVQLLITVKLEICFDSGQFVGGAKNLEDQCAAVIYQTKD